jgi:hypothetical protein
MEGAMQGTAFILIRSVVPNADDRKAFDHWYQTDHLPLAVAKVNITQAWRFQNDPSVHYALGEFSDIDELHRASSSDGFKFLIADYDRVWGSKGVTRTRDIIEKVQHLRR